MYRSVDPATGDIDYDLAIMLDAEDLAERGMAEGYDQVAAALREHDVELADLVELDDPAGDSYVVECLGSRYEIYGPGVAGDAWAHATVALFDIVNRQLADDPLSLFALNGGNELSGILPTAADARASFRALPRAMDRPYLPVAEPPWYGQPHD